MLALANGQENAKILSAMFAADNRTWSEKKADIDQQTQQQRLQNREKNAQNPNFIGPSKATIPNLLAMTPQQRAESAKAAIDTAVQTVNPPRSTPLDELRADGRDAVKPGMYTLSKAIQGMGNSVAGMTGAVEAVKDYAQYLQNGRQTPKPMPRLDGRPSVWDVYRDWSDFNTALSQAEQRYVSPARQTYGTVVQGATGMAIPMAAAPLTGGMGLVTGISAGGNAAMDAKLQGYNPEQSLARGMLTGVVQGGLTSKITDKYLPFRTQSQAGNAIKRFLQNQGKLMLAEGTEESIEDAAQLGIDYLSLNQKPTWEDWKNLPGQMLDSFVAGALTAGVMGLPGNISNARMPEWAESYRTAEEGAATEGINNRDTAGPRLEAYRDTPLQETQNRGTINPTEVTRNGEAQRNEYAATAGEKVSGTDRHQTDDGGRNQANTGTESDIRREMGQNIRDHALYQERNEQTQTGEIQRYKEIDPDVQMPPELQAIAEENARYGFSTAFVLDATKERDGVIKKQLGFYRDGTVYLDIEGSEPLADINRHELVHGGHSKNPDAFDDLYFVFYNNVREDALIEALEYYRKQYAISEFDNEQRFVEEFIADVAPLLDNPPTQEIFTDVDAVKQAYDVFFNSLGTKVSQQGSTQQAAEMDTENSTDTRLEQQAGVQPDLQQAKETIAQYADKTGRKVVWYNDQSNPDKAGTNGYMEKGVLYINENAQNPYMEVFKHELFHSLPKDAKQGVIDFFRTNVNENTPAFREFKAQEMQRQRQKNLKYSDADFWEEYAAQNAEFLLEEGYIENLVQTDRNLAQKILDAIKRLLERIRDIFAPGDYSSAVSTHESGRVSGLNDTRLRQTQRLYERALQNATPTTNEMKYSFAGQRAQQADMSALQRAQQMKADGAGAEDILRETGWFVGLDGQWRFELDDSQMKIDYDGMQQKREAWLSDGAMRLLEQEPNLTEEQARRRILRDEQMPLTLGDLLDYPELYRQYPDMADMPVYLYDSAEDYAGSYHPDSDAIVLTRSGMEGWKRTLPHEIQHAIQVREGFDMGFPSEGSPTDAQYWNSAGEIEAREAGRRQGMTADERRESLPMRNVRGAVLSDGSEAGPRYSIKTGRDGKPTVVIEEDIFAGHEGEKPHKVIRDYIKNHYTGDFARIIESGQKV